MACSFKEHFKNEEERGDERMGELTKVNEIFSLWYVPKF